MKSVGDFQANVGIFSSDVHLMITYILAGILIIIGVILSIVALIPLKPWDCQNLKRLEQEQEEACLPYTSGPEESPECSFATNVLEEEGTRCNTKVRHYKLLWFLVLIPFAVITVLISRGWNHLVHTNRTAAQIGGAMQKQIQLKIL